MKLSCAKLKFSLVRVVTEDDIEVIVAVQYLSGRGGGGGGQNEINARHLQTEVGVEVEDELVNISLFF